MNLVAWLLWSALTGAQAQEVAVLCAGGDPLQTIEDSLRCSGRFVVVDVLDTSTGSPSL